MKLHLLFALAIPALCAAADYSGNWVIAQPQDDGTFRRTYLNLKQDGDQITGTVRTTQFVQNVASSAPNDAGGYTLTMAQAPGMGPGSPPPGLPPNARPAVAPGTPGGVRRGPQYQIKLVGDELHVTIPGRGPNATPAQAVAHHAPPGEGVLPARIPPPALHKVPHNGLAKTPPMGWNSWNKFARRVDDAAVRGMADAMVSSGMRDAGYIYVNIDDTWEGERDAKGNITSNKKFPDMKALSDYVHSKGLKLGIYSSPGPNTCAGYEGSYAHEQQDANTFAAWGIDYLKYDWCGARNIYKDEEMQAVYQVMGDALQKTGRPIVYSLCQYGRSDVWKWGPDVGGNLWRTTGDIRDTWDSMANIGFKQNELAPWAAPGHWNDPDMLEIGNGGMSGNEYRVHMTLWSILAAPLIAGNDLRDMTPEIRDILMNREVIAIDQDKAGKQGVRISQNGEQEVWLRELEGGAHAVALFNRSTAPATISAKWSDLKLKGKPKSVRDLWSHKDLKPAADGVSGEVPAHGVLLVRLTK